MESKAQILGRSLKVPIVQELAKEKLSSVPSRYIRPDHQHLTAADVSSLPQIPVIDMQKLLLSDSMDSELHRLHEACLDWGFFQLINHGVDAAPIAKMRSEMTAFFNLPPEEKDVFRQKEDDVEGYGQAFVTSQEQKLDWADLFFILTQPPYLRKPHLIPKLPASFRSSQILQKLTLLYTSHIMY
ncbi:oxoglutarate-dependent flavonoid 7-O-demethylase 1-like [Salvia miltiorrhiza]|uniref:oxoglutarate-dependent flavonoid 7-O-demethylase 1-like n=1 Tax=Salvia miltiorrhiza TaxID=226208 RepID=UPI0025ABF9D7|nr:oxoglutarate-dependent flavonoid 7-O-demethylase 1-like [Salvia miltiorrhiza]